MKYCFDIDDTILFSELVDNKYVLRGGNKEIIDKINNLYLDGDEIILHTGRHWNHLKNTVTQLRFYGVKYTTLVMGKPVADFYIDDKGLRPDEFLGR
jgi:hydroxymethylpyrimidine pyrophosphatase-like HAD family hydrolase